MIERILPAPVVSATLTTDPPDGPLFAAEAAQVAAAVHKRRREFTSVRLCARYALAQLGRAPTPLPAGERGEPLWPAGVVGSMTHCAGYRAAAVAHSAEVAALGIDAEPHAALSPGVLDEIALPRERERLARLAADVPAVHWDRLLFSAKESVYKTWYPLTRRRLRFGEAEVMLHQEGWFTVRLIPQDRNALDGIGLDRLRGRWLTGRGLAVTAIVLHNQARHHGN
ncbi:4'-phosphopantetheinyl transferase EntD [Streptacidiphilus sp. MAP12-33]|uniref:4'-phosphopantetheinyl transferase family protein n=1 Tax=Streptacidiphilus sp. MAP12-33 TaxID=3156266 RepID=UPI003515F33E